MSDQILQCGIIGYGYMGEIRRAVIERHPGLALMGVCDPNPAIRKKLSSHCRVFDNLSEMLNEKVDIIFVCTPNCYSADIAIECMKAGKHVFCEKPPGRDLDDVARIRQALVESGLIDKMAKSSAA